MKLPAAKLSAGRGFTLVELLIVIAIIGTLVGLLLPAVNAARERARQGQCLNNMKEVGTAVISYATSKNGEFPGWVQVEKLTPGNGIPSLNNVRPYSGNIANPDVAISWAAKLLPNLDQAGLWDQLKSNNSSNGFSFDAPPKIEVFLCASDVVTNDELARLTYVANTGMYDPLVAVAANQASDLKANGIFHDRRPTRNGQKVKLGADLKDGAGTTLMLSENIHKDEEALGYEPIPNTWLGPLGVVPNALNNNEEQRYGVVWIYPGSVVRPGPLAADFFSQDTRVDNDPENADQPYGFVTSTQVKGSRFARPASAHPDTFNAVFAGGSARGIRSDVDYIVYQQLMTPNGAKAATWNNPNAYLTDYIIKPLSDSDY